jgi:hypothetical protein
MAALISDSDSDWCEYERTKRFLISIWRFLYAKKNHSTAPAPLPGGRHEIGANSFNFSDFMLSDSVSNLDFLEVRKG